MEELHIINYDVRSNESTIPFIYICLHPVLCGGCVCPVDIHDLYSDHKVEAVAVSDVGIQIGRSEHIVFSRCIVLEFHGVAIA